MKRTIWASEARLDLTGIDEFYAEHAPDHADEIGREAILAARFLTEYPHAGPCVEDDKRKWRVRGSQYLLIYRIVDDGVEILRVHHGRENWRGS